MYIYIRVYIYIYIRVYIYIHILFLVICFFTMVYHGKLNTVLYAFPFLFLKDLLFVDFGCAGSSLVCEVFL